MKIAIIGAGAIGSAIARKLARNGIQAVIANSRGPQSLKALTDELGPNIKAVTVKEAAQADVVFVAVIWDRLPVALKDLGPWNGRILVDANNAVEVPSLQAVNIGDRASSEVVAELAPGGPRSQGIQPFGSPCAGRRSASRKWPTRAVPGWRGCRCEEYR